MTNFSFEEGRVSGPEVERSSLEEIMDQFPDAPLVQRLQANDEMRKAFEYISDTDDLGAGPEYIFREVGADDADTIVGLLEEWNAINPAEAGGDTDMFRERVNEKKGIVKKIKAIID